MGTELTAKKWWLAWVLLTVVVAPAAWAEIIINVGRHQLLADTVAQEIELFVQATEGEQVQGLNLNVQIADGGPDAGGQETGPLITDIDIVTGTIFGANFTEVVNPEAQANLNFKQFEIRTTTTGQGRVFANGLLATLTIDTTGFFEGSFALRLSDTLNGATDFAGVAVTVTDGTIDVGAPIPEPTSWAILLAGTLIGLTRRRRIGVRH